MPVGVPRREEGDYWAPRKRSRGPRAVTAFKARHLAGWHKGAFKRTGRVVGERGVVSRERWRCAWLQSRPRCANLRDNVAREMRMSALAGVRRADTFGQCNSGMAAADGGSGIVAR